MSIPYIIIDDRMDSNDICKTTIDYNSVSENELQETLLKELKCCMEFHCFFDNLDNLDIDDNLLCDECGCKVMYSKYINIVNERQLCGACNPSEHVLNKELFDKFTHFLSNKGESCDILYFKNKKWITFVIE